MITTLGWGSQAIGTSGWGDRGRAGPEPSNLRPDIVDSLELAPSLSTDQEVPSVESEAATPRPQVGDSLGLRPSTSTELDSPTPSNSSSSLKPRMG